MKVLYIHQYFKTPAEGGGLRSYLLAKELVKKGVEVIMITAHTGKGRVRKEVDGIKVIYLPVAYANEMNFGRRSLAFIIFMIYAMVESLRHRHIDLCYVMTTPLTTGFVALFNKFILSRPYIFEVGDLWPKVPSDMGLIKSRWLMKLLLGVERIFYVQARGLVGLSDPITKHLQESAPKVQTQTISNIADCSAFANLPKDQLLASKFNLSSHFVISYTGTFGLANDLSRLISLAEKVQDMPVMFLLVGGGAEKQKLEKLVSTKKLNNVKIYDSMNRDSIGEVLNITDAMFVSFANVPSLHTGSPNKFFDALAAGKPVITNFNGWVGDLIESKKCGFVADSSEHFRGQLNQFINDKSRLRKYGERSRKLAEEQYDLTILSDRQYKFIAAMIN